MRGMRAIVTSAVAGALLAGCGGNSPPPPPAGRPPAPKTGAAAPAKIDPCSILTADDLKAATGKAVESSEHGAQDNVCWFKLGEAGKILFVVYTSAPKETFQGARGEPVPGLGDEARWNKTIGMLAVLKGQVSFSITMPPSMVVGNPDECFAAAKALAAKVIAKI